MPAPLVTADLGNTLVKVRWEEPFVSDGLNRKEIGVTPKGVYRGFVPSKVLGTSNIQFTVGPEGDSAAVFDTSGAVAHGLFVPTTGWNILVYTSATITVNITAILGGGGGATGVYAVVLRAQYNTGNAPVTDAFIQIVNKADIQATDVRLAEIDTTATAANIVNAAVLRLGPNAISMIPPFVTVGDGYESKGDFTGNRASFAGTDTSNAIQLAINGLDARNKLLTNFGGVAQGPSSKGGIIFVKRGKYGPSIPAAAILPLTGMKIVGEGYGSSAAGINTVEITRALGFPGITVSAIGIEVSNLTMIGQADAFPLIRLAAAIDCIVRDVSFRDNAAYAALELNSAVGNLIEDVRSITGILDVGTINGGTVLITQGNNNKIQGLPVDVRLQPLAANFVFDNHILTGRVTTPDHAGMPGLAVAGSKLVNTSLFDDAFDGLVTPVLNSGSPSFGSVSTYMRGYIKGLNIVITATGGAYPSGTKIALTAGDIEIDGLFYGLRIPVDVTATIIGAPVAGNFVSFYARRKTGAPNIGSMEIVGYIGTGAASLPVYNRRRNAWTRFGTGTVGPMGTPSERFLGTVQCTGVAPTVYRSQQMAGNWVLFENADLLVAGPTANFTRITPAGAGIETIVLTPSQTLTLSNIPPIPMASGIPIADIPVGGGENALTDSIPVLLDAELFQTDSVTDDRNAFAYIGSPLTIGQDFTGTFGGWFRRQSSGPNTIAPRFRSSTFMTLAAVAGLGAATVTVRVQQEVPLGANTRTYQVRVFQRGYLLSR